MEHLRKRWLRLVISKATDPKYAVGDEVVIGGRKGTVSFVYPELHSTPAYNVKTNGGFSLKVPERDLTPVARTSSLTGEYPMTFNGGMATTASPEYSFVVDKYDDEVITSGPWSSRETAVEQMAGQSGLKVITLPRWGAENPLCPDHSAHSENAAERLFGSIRGGRNEAEDITLDCFTEAEYRTCEGHA